MTRARRRILAGIVLLLIAAQLACYYAFPEFARWSNGPGRWPFGLVTGYAICYWTFGSRR